MPVKKLLLALAVVGWVLSMQACATMEQDEIATVDEQRPQVSKVLTQEAPERFLKRKVAIGRFSNETKYGQSIFLDEDLDRIGKQAMDILSARLAATEKFILLERSDIEKINKELALGNLSALNIPADYLIIGSVSEFGRKAVSDVGILSRVKKQVAYAKVNIRLVDIMTGQIIYSEEGEGEAFAEAGTVMGVGSRAGYDSSLNDKAISAAISKLVNDIVENLTDKPWRSYILSKEGDIYMMSGGGSQGIRVDDVFNVYRRGKRVKNPQTGMFIELPGVLVGKIQVRQIVGSDPNSELSMCALISGSLPESGFEDLYVEEPAGLR